MQRRKLIYSGILIGIILVVVFGLIIFFDSQKIVITFLDVGQGDSILISQGSNQVLIDGGPSGQILMERLGKYIPFWDRKIEAVIATHPDQDHIGGLVVALRNYKVDMIMENSRIAESKVYKNLKNVIDEKEINKIDAEVGTKIKFPNGAKLEVIYAKKDGSSKNNNSKSIVSKLIFGQNSFLLTGDIPDSEENKLSNTKATVLKVSHHGSKNSTTENFLDKTKAKTAIISAGKNNRYGHPADEVLERLEKFKMSIFRTDELGDIQFVCQRPKEDCQLVEN